MLLLIQRNLLSVSILAIVAGLLVVHGELRHFSFAFPHQRMSSAFSLQGSGFIRNGAYVGVAKGTYAAAASDIALFGSWAGGDASTGAVISNWIPVRSPFCLLISGYPASTGNFLAIELLDKNGHRSTLSRHFDNVGEQWELASIHIPDAREFVSFRIAAKDGTRDVGGWLGFSEPFTVSSMRLWEQTLSLLAVFLTACAAFIAYFFPGLLLRLTLRTKWGKELAFAASPVIGILLLTLIGIIIWACPPYVHRQRLACILLLLLFGVLAFILRGQSLGRTVNSVESRVLMLVGVVVLVATAKATFSLGPLGELYGHSISRTLEVGGRSDSRIAFHNVQLVAHGDSPHGAEAQMYFAPWDFSSRGPLAGLAAASLVIASGAHVPSSMPMQPWLPYDGEGFAAYRIAMITMASSAFIIFFGLVRKLVDEKFGYFAFVSTLTMPFLVHEVYFTWSKMESAAFILLAASLLIENHFIWAGLTWGFAYLFHPLALFSAPAFVALLLYTKRQTAAGMPNTNWRSVLRRGMWLTGGLSACVLLWRIVNWNHFHQQAFLGYLRLPSARSWWSFRLTSLLNTIVPFWLYVANNHDPNVNAYGIISPRVVQFFFVYWDTLPFGAGLVAFPIVLAAGCSFALRHWHQFLGVIVLPFVLFWLFWGISSSGLLREGLQPWMFAVAYIVAVMCYRVRYQRPSIFRMVSVVFGIRGLEVLAMLLVPAICTNDQFVSDLWWLNDSVTLCVMCAGVAFLSIQSCLLPEKLWTHRNGYEV